MKYISLALFLFKSFLSFNQIGEVDLFIVAGQSNAQGYTSFANDYQPDQLDQQILLYYNNFYSNNNTVQWTTMRKQPDGQNNNSILGPEWIVSRKNAALGRKTAIYKCAIPGTSLNDDWKKPGQNGIFDLMIRNLDTAIVMLNQQYSTINIKGFIWIQGEYDALTQNSSAQYENNLNQLIDNFRKKYGIRIPFLIGVDEQYPALYINKIIEAQGNISFKKENVGIISLEGLQKHDNTHLTFMGNVFLGERIYSIYNSMISNSWNKKWTNAGTNKIGNTILNFNDNIHFSNITNPTNSDLILFSDNNVQFYSYQNSSWIPIKINNKEILLAYDQIYFGDFDGDNFDEILAINIIGKSSIFKLSGLYLLEIWTDNGQISNSFFPYKRNITVGDFDGDGKDEILAAASSDGWITMFKLMNNNLQWMWSDYGDATNPLRPYRDNLNPIDYNADGKKSIIGLAGWATILSFENNSWQWKWSTYGSNNINGWSYPLHADDKLIIANFDDDLKDEIFFIQTQTNAQWATTMDFNANDGNWNWNWSANPQYSQPFIFDHNIKPIHLSSKYYYCKIYNKANVVTFKKRVNNIEISIFENSNNTNKAIQDKKIVKNNIKYELNKLKIYPNPFSNELICESEILIEEVRVIEYTNGNEVYVEHPNSKSLKITLESLTPGVYLVIAKFENGEIQLEKIVKKE